MKTQNRKIEKHLKSTLSSIVFTDNWKDDYNYSTSRALRERFLHTSQISDIWNSMDRLFEKELKLK